jgi:hypothetical protein
LTAKGTINHETVAISSDISSESSNGSDTTSASSFIMKLTDKLASTFKNSDDDEDRELDCKLKRIQIEAAQAQRDFYLQQMKQN